MDGIANVARQQQSQISSTESQVNASVQKQAQVQESLSTPKDASLTLQNDGTNINSKQDVEELVGQLNKAIEPLNTNLKFGVDSQDIFYVSVIESKTNKMIRRFPAEQAQDFLPKMQEVSGILFDSKG